MEKKTIQINFRGTPAIKTLLEMMANYRGESEGQYLCTLIFNEAKSHLLQMASVLAIGDAAEACGLPKEITKGMDYANGLEKLKAVLKEEVYQDFQKYLYGAEAGAGFLFKRMRELCDMMGVTDEEFEAAMKAAR